MKNLINHILKKILRLKRKDASLRDTIEDLIEEDKASTDQSIEENERDMLFNLLQLRKIKVEEIMTSRNDIFAIPVTSTIDELFTKFITYKKNSILVYQKTIDNIVGVIYLRDVLHLCRSYETTNNLSQYVRKVLFIPPSMMNLKLLLTMKHENMDKAVVVNEYGGVDGVVSLSDIVDEIVGDIEEMKKLNEYKSKIYYNNDGSLTIDASMSLKYLDKISGININSKNTDVETIAGLVLLLAGKMPTAGEIIRVNDFDIKILDVNARQIKTIQIGRGHHD